MVRITVDQALKRSLKFVISISIVEAGGKEVVADASMCNMTRAQRHTECTYTVQYAHAHTPMTQHWRRRRRNCAIHTMMGNNTDAVVMVAVNKQKDITRAQFMRRNCLGHTSCSACSVNIIDCLSVKKENSKRIWIGEQNRVV